MKNSRKLEILGIILAAFLMLQTAIIALGEVLGGNGNGVDTSSVVVSQEIQDIIRQQDPTAFARNLDDYKRMIVLLDVHETFKAEIENLVVQGKGIKDLMIAYSFLNDAYGTIDQLEPLIDKKEQGKGWAQVFKLYNDSNPAFIPRNFDFDYLDEIMKSGNLTADDIMIADRVSQKSGAALEELIENRLLGLSWKSINAELGIVNASSNMPRVPVTAEQLKKYTVDRVLNEDRVVQTLVTAFKLGMDADTAIGLVKNGYTTEMLFAKALEEKYK